MKTKQNAIQRVIMILFATLTMFSCQKKDEVAVQSTASFTVDGTTYSGLCTAVNATTCTTGKDVGITSTTGTNNFVIYNIPIANSGTFNFNNGSTSVGTCNLWGGYVIGTTSIYVTKTGTITKTGANSFTFSCTVNDITTNISKTITGSGKY